LSAKKYYNLVRNQPTDKGDSESIQGLLKALDDAEFIHHQRISTEYNAEGKLTGQRLTQIWFAHLKQLAAAQRFVADQVLIIDGTFNTNELRLPLLAAVGITNSGSTFPVAFSYCPLESKESLKFFFDCLTRECFKREDNIPPCRVVIGDQAAGLIAALPEALPQAILQSCDWHAVEAMKRRFRTSGYKKDQVDILSDLCWIYIKSATAQELEDNRERLIEELRPAEKKYIRETWLPKEERVVYYYTDKYMNLGCTSSSRSESYHPVLRVMTNGQLSLEQSAKRLASTVISLLKALDLDEDSSERDRPRRLQRDKAAFRFLFDEISLFALNKLADEWELVKRIAANLDDIGNELCQCQLLLRWYLPCKHHLFAIVKSGQPIPKSLIHPRWWIKGPIIRFSGWVPTNQEASNTGIRETNYLSPRRRQHTSAGQHLLVVRDALSSIDQAYIDDEIAQNDRRILGLAQAAYEGRGVPVAQPLPIPKQKWVPKKAHGKANARGLTGAEIAARELNAREREQRLQERDQLALNMTLGASTAAEIPQFGPRDVSVVTGQ
jgi:MULE transposase domain